MMIVILTVLLFIFILSSIYYSLKSNQIIQINEETIEKNKQLQTDYEDLVARVTKRNNELSQLNVRIENLQSMTDEASSKLIQKKRELSFVKESIEQSTNSLNQINSSTKSAIESQKNIVRNEAQAEYNKVKSEYDRKLQQEKEQIDKELQKFESDQQALKDKAKNQYAEVIADCLSEVQKAMDKVTFYQTELNELKEKQTAYIRERQRQEEMTAKLDYYRLNLDEGDLQDIKSLKALQPTFRNKDAIDKVIWESYVKSAYDTLMTHLFKDSKKVCGIYKITNISTGKAYVGQSVDIKERWRQHIKSGISYSSSTNKLYQEMKKYGIENFTFEILEEVVREKLNEREVYWIDMYQTKEYGMNATKGGS